jgi:hypothetical protein
MRALGKVNAVTDHNHTEHTETIQDFITDADREPHLVDYAPAKPNLAGQRALARRTQVIGLQRINSLDSLRSMGPHHPVRTTSNDTEPIQRLQGLTETAEIAQADTHPGETNQPYYGDDGYDQQDSPQIGDTPARV